MLSHRLSSDSASLCLAKEIIRFFFSYQREVIQNIKFGTVLSILTDSKTNHKTTVRFTKSGSVLPLYKISVLLKTGGAGVFIVTRKINIVIKALFVRFDR